MFYYVVLFFIAEVEANAYIADADLFEVCVPEPGQHPLTVEERCPDSGGVALAARLSGSRTNPPPGVNMGILSPVLSQPPCHFKIT